MNTDRAIMQAKLASEENRAAKLKLQIEGAARSVRLGLNTAVTPVPELEIPVIAEQFDQIVSAWGELQAVLSRIERLRRELG